MNELLTPEHLAWIQHRDRDTCPDGTPGTYFDVMVQAMRDRHALLHHVAALEARTWHRALDAVEDARVVDGCPVCTVAMAELRSRYSRPEVTP